MCYNVEQIPARRAGIEDARNRQGEYKKTLCTGGWLHDEVPQSGWLYGDKEKERRNYKNELNNN